MWRMSRALSAPGLDVIVFPTVYSYVPVFTRARKILFLHDVIPETFPRLALGHPAAEMLWGLKTRAGVMQADCIATVSEYSRAKLMEHFGLPEERVRVVGEAADPVFRRIENPRPTAAMLERGLDGRGRMVVYVGGFGPHKNLRMLVEVFAHLSRRRDFQDVRLVLAGEAESEVFHSGVSELRGQVARLGLGGRVVFTGYLEDEDLAVLLNLAAVLVLPSLMEGFGLPAIEAAACGCRVIATRESPLPELLGERTRFIDPRAPEDLRQAIECVLTLGDSQELGWDPVEASAPALSWTPAARQLKGLLRTTEAGPAGPCDSST
jgi:glycosyltransferase involved in cell wall biosynthesis